MANFAQFDPHASYKDAQGYPVLHYTYHWLETIIYLLVGLFALHMFFWFVRSFIHARWHGRDRPCVAESRAITSFVSVDRVIYPLLIVSFVGLVVTGLPLKYGSYPWARRLAGVVGGFPDDEHLAPFVRGAAPGGVRGPPRVDCDGTLFTVAGRVWAGEHCCGDRIHPYRTAVTCVISCT